MLPGDSKEMNERIKQLAEQAGITFTDYGSGEFFDGNDIDVPNLEKFAELIIKECADNVARQPTNIHPVVIAEVMKRTFGVEE